MAEGNGNGWSTAKVFTVILAINAILLPICVSLVIGMTNGYAKQFAEVDGKFEAYTKIYGDHEKRIVVLEERVLSKQEKQELLSLLSDSRKRTGR